MPPVPPEERSESLRQQFLYFFPLPQEQGSLRLSLIEAMVCTLNQGIEWHMGFSVPEA